MSLQNKLPSTQAIGDPKDVAAVRDVFDKWIGAVQAHDIDGVLARHVDDVVMFDVPPPARHDGIAAYRATWDLFYNYFGKDGVFAARDLAIVAGSDVAFSHCIVTCDGNPGGKDEPLTVRLTTGYLKSGGEWVIAHEHHSLTAGEG